ncbi:hypothetical protein SIAM614_19771 [Stappia aggregata IAM 12614]|uniref:DUF2336 domain-containing protein n=1 Tax=Roseibium aggregatum (strain ATCC 25650 / DSM 13394 / JCM 20685 / NBRC 16684 / NCIMB 2208 / IAM 12614 / B1) TaxID=384765 RepID=A0NVT1_ROSAI|nr:DUF2336 domain-containing protein [Roseibium aggregatum]EAV43096.1 hypothetical protein SIAM614_19771 [Stappia aggregata IAM 12614] [Roseibium aggregatum IAM 12614]
MFNLAKLAELARDSSAAGRRSLVSTLTDLFVSSGDDRDEQISLLFGDIVLKVLGQLEEETRIILSKRVCKEKDAPRDLMVKLAQDAFPVAGPVLENSPALTSDDLVAIASSASMEHLGAIAGRETVDKAVTSVLVDRGDTSVLSKVAENQGAEFADASFLKLVDKARSSEAIQAALINRTDLPEEAAHALLPFLTEELKERVSALGADSTLVQLLAERAATEVAARAHKLEEAREQSNALIRDVVNKKTKIDEAVTLFARSDRTAELGILLAKVSNLPPAAVSQLLFSSSDKPLIILCKANGVTAEAYKDILTMRARRLRIGGLELNAAIQRYAALSEDGARRSLETLKQSGANFGLKTEEERIEAETVRSKKNIPFASSR